MALTSKNIAIGSGSLYITEHTAGAAIPADATLETEANRLGDIKDGASVQYTANYYEAKDDLGRVSKNVLTDETVVLNAGVITWNAETLAKLCATGVVTEEKDPSTQEPTGKVTLSVGGLDKADLKTYVVRFVHADKKHRVTLLGNNQTGFTLGYKKDAETSIGAEFKAVPFDITGKEGVLFEYEDTSDVE